MTKSKAELRGVDQERSTARTEARPSRAIRSPADLAAYFRQEAEGDSGLNPLVAQILRATAARVEAFGDQGVRR